MDKFTFAFPCRNNVKHANEVIRLVLEHSHFPILIADDISDALDDEYTIDKRVRIMYNSSKKGLNSLWNQLLLESQTDYIMIGCHKLRSTKRDFDIISNKLTDGFACAATYRLGLFGFNKGLCSIIGGFDEGYTCNNFEDTDWMNKLFVNDLALYVSEETEYINTGTTWEGPPENGLYYRGKWEQDQAWIRQLHGDKNYMRHRLETLPTYLPWSKSELNVDNIREFYKNRVGIKYVS